MIDNFENRKVAVKLQNVKKMYKLGQVGAGTLRADLQSWWAKKCGKEDPNTKIGEKVRLIGQTFMALNGIDLTIYQGEAIGIIGGNGAGKSTLLKLLSRITSPTDGIIDIYGRIASMLEVGTGFNPEMTGRENVYMNGAILGMTKDEIDSKMAAIIEFSEVKDFIDTPVKRYSSGMYVKLAFSVAAHLDSEILIMDEVLAVGDMQFQKKCLDKMRDAATREGRTVLYVSHNMNTIRHLCDRCVVLNQGKIEFVGDVEEGIEYYFGKNTNSTPIVDVKSLPRKKWIENSPVKITTLTVNNDKAIFEYNGVIEGNIFVESQKDISGVTLLIVLSQNGIAVTASTSKAILELKANEKNNFRFEIGLEHIAPGNYTLKFQLYESEISGNFNVLDDVFNCYTFEIVANNNFNSNIKWNPQFRGYLVGNDIKILDNQGK